MSPPSKLQKRVKHLDFYSLTVVLVERGLQLLKLVEEKRWEQETYVKVKQVNRKGITHIGSVKVDDRFWPCMSWEKRGGKWQQKRHSGFQFDT